MGSSNSVFLIPLLWVILYCDISHAQQKAENKIGPWVWGVQGGVVHQLDTDLSDADGDFSLNRYFIRPSVGYAWDKRNSVSLSLGFVEYDYSFSSQAGIDDQAPWGKIREYRVAVPIRFGLSKNTDALIIPGIISRAEKGVSIADGKSERVRAGIRWRVSDTLKIGPGVGWNNSLGGGSRFFPFLMLDWSITENLSLATGSAFGASKGPGLSLNYDINKDWQVSLAARNEKTRFALDDKGTTPEGFGRDKNFPVYVSVQYSPWTLTKFSAFVSSKFGGELSLEDSQRDNIGRSNYDVAYAIGLTFRSRF